MNKTAIKNFAIWARNKLIADISYRAGLMGITADGIHSALPQSTGQTEFYDIGTVEPYAITEEAIRQRKHLVERIRQKEKDTDYKIAYKYIIEEVAYTWFNRLIAVRFMEVNDYLPSHIRVLSSDTGKLEPDLVTTPFDAELEFTRDEQQAVLDLKNANKLDEVFRMLFIKQCNALNEILPALFEKTNDYTELLLNLSVIDQDGVVYHLVHDIPEEDFDVERGGQVEIIGWLYQYYNTEPKNEAFAKSGKISKEEIPAVTQLFTPDWIVRYMVENSVGRLWIEHLRALDESADEAALAADFGWKYYLPEAKQEPEVEEKLRELRKERASLTPEQITMIDPCMGSGHILVYGFSVLMQIYENAGYGRRDAAKSILEYNLFGLDIDDRAYQMAYFAIMMKAREYNRRLLNGENSCKVYAIQESNGITDAALGDMGAKLSDEDRLTAMKEIKALIAEFKDAKEYGSILKIEKRDWDLLRCFAVPNVSEGQLSLDMNGAEPAAERLQKIIDIAEIISAQYWVSFTNPPYLGSGQMSMKLIEFIREEYPNSKADLFGPMIEKCMAFCKKYGFISMITQQTWMFLPSFEKLREIILNGNVVNLLQFGAHAFDEIGGEVVQTAAFVWNNNYPPSGYMSTYARLVDGKSEAEKIQLLSDKKNLYTMDQVSFSRLPGRPIAYWVENNLLEDFRNPPMTDFCTPRVGCQTSDNNRFLRLWFEVDINRIGFGASSEDEADMLSVKWFPFNKGGNYRKWYGNRDYVVNWENKGYEVKAYASSMYGNDTRTVKNQPYYFKRCFSWSKIFSGNASFRYYETGFVFSDAGLGVFTDDDEMLFYVGGFLNSTVSQALIKLLSPTLNLTSGIIEKMPLIVCESEKKKIISLVQECIQIEREDFNESEISWDFSGAHFKQSHSLSELVEKLIHVSSCREKSLLVLENNINSIFVNLYGQNEENTIAPEDITATHYNAEGIIKNVLSYAVGCMFGRYSLDAEGLAYAGGEWNPSKYASFLPDVDNVIPITDEEYLEDDIVSRLSNWLKVVYGESSLEENLDFIAKALSNKGGSSREIIRNYFLNDFFKDHCQTYSVTGSGKRPIYWLFDSGKQNGFKALIYLHRYNADTIGNLRIDYLHRMQRIYESEINRMQDMIDHSTNAREVGQATKRRDKLTKQLKECREYDEKLAHLALSRVELDLDDGVKVNYRKIQTANDGKFYEVMTDSKNIMANDKLWKQHLELAGK